MLHMTGECSWPARRRNIMQIRALRPDAVARLQEVSLSRQGRTLKTWLAAHLVWLVSAALVITCLGVVRSAFGLPPKVYEEVGSAIVQPPSPSAIIVHAETLAATLIAEWQTPAPTSVTRVSPVPCNSSLFGDTPRTGWGSFCKHHKAANHCKFCKCKECSFCKSDSGTEHTTTTRTPLTPSVTSLPEGTPFAAAVTSIFLPHLLSIRAAGYPINLFSRERATYVPRDVSHWRREPLFTRAYYDGAGTPPQLPAVEWYDLDVVQPWAKAFVREQRRVNSSVQRAYRRRRYTCIAPATDLSTCADVFTVYKVAAIVDAVRSLAAQHLIWIDLDAFLQRPLDSAFWRWTSRFAVATIGARTPHNPETGAQRRHYIGEECPCGLCPRDAHIFCSRPCARRRRLLEDFPGARVGGLSQGSLRKLDLSGAHRRRE